MFLLLGCTIPEPADTGEPCEPVPAWADGDGDGYGAPGTMRLVCEVGALADNDDDCDDGDAEIHPAASEVCNGVDDDCSGGADADAEDAATWFLDFDGDGYGGDAYTLTSCEQPSGYVSAEGDCDDGDAEVAPGVDELCDGVDQDCDGLIDEDALDASSWYLDADGDGHGTSATVQACELPEGYAELDDDCDDGEAAIHPGAEELCNEVDDDCDGAVDFDGWVPGAFASLEDAVAGAADGAHLCVDGTLGSSNLELGGKALTLQGAEGAVLDGGGDWLFQLDEAELSLVHLEIRDLAPNGYSGALAEGYQSDLSLRYVDLHGVTCDSYCYGALVQLSEGDLELSQVSISDVRAENGVESLLADVQQGSVTIDGLDIYDLRVTDFGGMFYTELEGRNVVRDITLRDSTFEGSYWYGGLFYGYEGQLELDGVELSGNVIALEDGQVEGGLYLECMSSVEASHIRVVGNEITGVNQLRGFVADIYESGYADFDNVLVAGNTVESSGGELYGAVFHLDTTDLELSFVDIAHNDLGSGWDTVYGGVLYTSESLVQLDHLNVVDHVADADEVHGTVAWLEYDGAHEDFDVLHSNLYELGTGAPWAFWDEGATGPSGFSELDPMYEDVTGDPADWDLHLSSASPLVDAGDPDCSDADGTVCDLGAYGGPGGSW